MRSSARQPQASTGEFRGEERVKQRGFRLLVHPTPRVLDLEEDVATSRLLVCEVARGEVLLPGLLNPCGNGNRATPLLANRLGRIGDEIHDHLLDLLVSAFDFWQRIGYGLFDYYLIPLYYSSN